MSTGTSERKIVPNDSVMRDFHTPVFCEEVPRIIINRANETHFSQTAIRRKELKYILSEETYRAFRKATERFLEPDQYAYSKVKTTYLDTSENAFVRRSIEKPSFKEKLRIRTYAENPSLEDSCFLEIKKKLMGTVFKRRVEMSLSEAFAFCLNGIRSEAALSVLSDAERYTALQVLREIGWLFMQNEGLSPSFSISCRRLSLKECNTDSLRITFDRDLLWSYSPAWGLPKEGERALIDPQSRIMEIKSTKGMPFWLVDVLNRLEIRPQSFSKVGRSYRAWLSEGKADK